MKEQITLFKDTQLKHLMLVKRNVVDAKATDLYIIQGGDLYSNGNGSYWTRTSNYLNSNRLFVSRASFDVYDIDNYYYIEANSAKIGVRPIMSLSEINKSKQNLNKKRINGITEIEYGEYPQSIEDEKIAKELEKLYQTKNLIKTKKSYTFIEKKPTKNLIKNKKSNNFIEEKPTKNLIKNKRSCTFIEKKQIKNYQEYFYNNNKYIRVDNPNILDKREIPAADINGIYWVKVEPIKWLVIKSLLPEINNVAMSKNILLCMPFSYDKNNNYKESDIKEFLEKYFVKEIIPSKITLTNEEEKILRQKRLLKEKLEKSNKVYNNTMKKEGKIVEDVKIIEEEQLKKEEMRKQKIEELEDDLIRNFEDFNEKYKKLLEFDSSKEKKYPHICLDKDVLCNYDMKEKCYKIKEKFIPYLSYIQFPFDMENVDVRGLDLSNSIVYLKDIYKKSLEGCNLNGNEYILNEVSSFEGYNLDNANVYSDNMLFLNGAFINTKTIESINKKYLSEALNGAILDSQAVEFLKEHREEYGINKSINVKVRNGKEVDNLVLFPEFSKDKDNHSLIDDKYYNVIKEFKEKGISKDDLKNIEKIIDSLNVVEEKENKFKHK